MTEPTVTDPVVATSTESDDVVAQTAAQSTPISTSKKNSNGHKVGVNKAWLTEYKWLYFDTEQDEDNMTIDVMRCKLCTKHNSHGSNGKKTWSKEGYRLLRKDKCKKHQDSDQHKHAVTLEMANDLDSLTKKINTGAQKSIRDALRVLYFILKNNLSLDLLGPLIDLCVEVGATDLPKLRLAKNANYSSYDTIHDLLDVLSSKVHQLTLEELRQSPCFSTMVDEVTDNRTIKHMAICTRYIDSKGDIKTSFLTDTELTNATADAITESINTELKKNELNSKDMAGFASDGAAVFIGKKTGVATQLKKDNPQLLTHHCRDHRLALACRDSFNNIPQMKKLDQILETLYKYYKYSCKNNESLKSVQKAFNQAPLSIKQAKHHRWLSHDQAVTSIVRSYKCIIVDLESSEISKDPVGHGLLKNLKDPSTLRALLLLADVLPHMASLSLVFQRRDVHLGNIKSSVEKTVTLLEKRKTQPGPWLLKETQMKKDANISLPTPADFDSKVGTPFLDTMITNITDRFTDTDTIDQLSILDLTGTDHLEMMYGYTEIESLAQKFDTEPEDLLLQWQDFIELINTRDPQQRSLLDLQKLFHSPDHADLNLDQMYPLIHRLYSIAVVQPLSTAEVERVFSQVKLIKTSHRSNLKTSTLTKILTVKLNCNQRLFDSILDECVQDFFKKKDRRLLRLV